MNNLVITIFIIIVLFVLCGVDNKENFLMATGPIGYGRPYAYSYRYYYPYRYKYKNMNPYMIYV